MAKKKVYDNEFKIQAVKLGREIGFSKAAKELGVNIDTLYGWNKRAKDARLDLGPGTQTPDTAMSLTEEVQKLRQQNRELEKSKTKIGSVPSAGKLLLHRELYSRRDKNGDNLAET